MMVGSPSIDKQVGTLTIFPLIPVVVIIVGKRSTVAFGVDVGGVECIDYGVVEFEPFALLVLDVAYVVTHFGITDVAYYASQIVLIIRVILCWGVWQLFFLVVVQRIRI